MPIKIPQRAQPFLPRHLEKLKTRMHRAQGTLLFSDISGFTSMSEKLGASGKTGTEELTGLLTHFFDAMLQITNDFQGNVLKFIGDAMLVWFTDTEKAETCAQIMMEKMVDFKKMETSNGMYELSMKIILAQGSWIECVLGDDCRSTLFLCGDLIKKLAKTEEQANSGEIVTVALDEVTDWDPPEETLPSGMTGDSFLPRGSSEFHDRDLFGEHRPVACVFLKFSGYDENRPSLEGLQDLFKDTMNILNEYHGSFQGIDSISLVGSKMLILFGAPHSHGDDTRSAVSAAHKMVGTLMTKHDVQIKAAVHQGYVYAGIIGNALRRQYTVIGDIVNTTARLVESASHGQVVVSQDVKRVTHTYIDYAEIEPVEVKGKHESLKRFVPQEIRDQQKHGYEFVGRTSEMQQIVQAVKKHSVIVINGEAGIGKSRLLQELGTLLKQQNYTVLNGTTDELKPAFSIFASMIGHQAGVVDVETAEEKKEKLQKLFVDLVGSKQDGSENTDDSIEEDDLYRRLPFIGSLLFGLTYPGSIYEDIEPQLRYENLIQGLRLYLSYQNDPVCVILDDLQWTKQEDRYAIRDLVRLLQLVSKKDISFVLSKRPQLEEIEFDPELKLLNIDLAGLDNESAAILALQILDGLPLEESLDRVIKEKSEGNPFYLEQFLFYLREKGLINKKGQKWVKIAGYRDEDLPENVFSMIMARIDQLEESAKESLRVASVVGFEFKESIIAAVMNMPVHEHILKTVNERLIYINNVIELEYVFSHAVIKDVVYDSILRQRRNEIHKSIGKALEEIYPDNLYDYHEALAYHYYHGQDWKKAFYYTVKSGEKTRAAFRNEEALLYYERAIEIISQSLSEFSGKLVTLHEQAGELYVTIGKYQEAEQHYDAMLSVCNDDVYWKIRALRHKAGIKDNLSQYDACSKLLVEIQSLLDSCTKNADIQIEEGLVFCHTCSVDKVKGNMQRAVQRSKDVIKQLESIKTNDKKTKQRIDLACAGVIRSVCGIYYSLGQYEKAIETYQDAQRIYEIEGDKSNLAVTYGHMGLFYHGLHDYQRAIELQQKCLDLQNELGHRRAKGIASGNLGLVFREIGEYTKARECFECHLMSSKELGDRLGEAIASANIGALHHLEGEFEDAYEYYDHHREICEKLGDKFGIARAYENLGEIQLIRGNYITASEYFVRQLSAYQAMGNQEGIANACYHLSQSSIKTGKYHEARKLLEKAEQIYRSIKNLYTLVVVYSGLAEAIFKIGENDKEALQYAEKAYELSIEIDNKQYRARAFLILAQIFAKTGDHGKAAQYYNKAIELAVILKNRHDLAEAHFFYGEYLNSRNNPEGFEHLKYAREKFTDLKLHHWLVQIEKLLQNNR